jgi:hypothetical protein
LSCPEGRGGSLHWDKWRDQGKDDGPSLILWGLLQASAFEFHFYSLLGGKKIDVKNDEPFFKIGPCIVDSCLLSFFWFCTNHRSLIGLAGQKRKPKKFHRMKLCFE